MTEQFQNAIDRSQSNNQKRRKNVLFLFWVGIVAPMALSLSLGIAESTDSFVMKMYSLLAHVPFVMDWLVGASAYVS